MKTRLAAGAAVLFAVVGLHAKEMAPWQIHAELLVVEMPAQNAQQLIPALRNPVAAPKSVAEIERLVAKGTATLLARPVIWARNGQHIFSTTHEEIRFPTECDPVQGSGDFGSQPAMGGQPTRPADPNLSIPVAHEIRDTGVSLEATLTVIPGSKNIVVSMFTRHVALDQWNRVLGETPEAALGLYEQPHFHTFQITTKFVAASGNWNLSGVFVVPQAPDRIELFLLRAIATQPGHD